MVHMIPLGWGGGLLDSSMKPGKGSTTEVKRLRVSNIQRLIKNSVAPSMGSSFKWLDMIGFRLVRLWMVSILDGANVKHPSVVGLGSLRRYM